MLMWRERMAKSALASSMTRMCSRVASLNTNFLVDVGGLPGKPSPSMLAVGRRMLATLRIFVTSLSFGLRSDSGELESDWVIFFLTQSCFSHLEPAVHHETSFQAKRYDVGPGTRITQLLL